MKCEKARCDEVLSGKRRYGVDAGDESLWLKNVIGTVFLKRQTLLTLLARNSLISEFLATEFECKKNSLERVLQAISISII